MKRSGFGSDKPSTGSFRAAATAIGLAALAIASRASAEPEHAPPTAETRRLSTSVWSTARTPDQRAHAAVAAMTLEEKVALLSTPLPGLPEFITHGARIASPPGLAPGVGFIAGVPRLGLPPIAETDASLGVANPGETRKGDYATGLPASIALGASFDPALANAGGRMIGGEARSKGYGVMLAGGANLIRDPRAGRNFEYMSEDPLLTGVMAGQAIKGVQSNRIISTLKHFALNNQETGRFVYDLRIGEATMRESDLLAFEIAHEIGRPGAVMCAYNRVNARYACENPMLLNDVLRGSWGFDGFVMSDWGAAHSTEAILAGLDQESGYQLDKRHYFGPDLLQAVASGKVPVSAVDRAATRVVRTLFASGVYDAPPVRTAIDFAANSEVSLRQAEAGIVLLRNEGAVLPLTASVQRIAVIGGHADVGVLVGGGSSQVVPPGGVKLAIKSQDTGFAGPGKQRIYVGEAPLQALRRQFPQATVEFADGTDRAAAAALAARSQIAIVFAEKWSVEGADEANLSLDPGTDHLIDAVASANRRTVVVLETGNPILMPWRDKTAAILQAWYPGPRGGEAIARVLSGAVNPSGHLPVTFPAATDQLPHPALPGSDVAAPPKGGSIIEALNDKVPFSFSYREGADVGYRWYLKTGASPLFPFGHGLSYTSFRYSNLEASRASPLEATFTVTNSGGVGGTDVPQVYVAPPGGVKRLVGWARPTLEPGQQTRLTVKADMRTLADYEPKTRRWILPAGTYRLEVGSSALATQLSAEVRLARTVLQTSSK